MRIEVSPEEAYKEATAALGETIVRQRLFADAANKALEEKDAQLADALARLAALEESYDRIRNAEWDVTNDDGSVSTYAVPAEYFRERLIASS